ncbi:hypothetical protein HHK36_016152 [Tetracentron sinense]|uniref:Pentatricopeptide repeat-containing protein-mitochondrial domain-containing protein n=1 Tax=Tetracentron sinense TaxID=13715 RepID=A0A834YZS4_TETSI|nr:hypothetical protein HHK36_016152 [Tetracentron sinense]
MFVLRKLPPKFPQSPSLLCTITPRFLCKSTNPPENPSPENPNPENPSPEKPSAAYYDNLITIAGRSRDFTTIHHLLNQRVKDGFFNTTNTFKFVTDNDDDLDQLTQSLETLDRGFPRKSAFDALIARLCKSNQIDKSLRVIDTMVRGSHGINACTFHPILNALTRNKSMDEAWRVLALMREIGISPDLTSYNSVLTAYCVAGDLSAAAGVLGKIQEEGMEVDPRTYDAMVLGACRAGKVDGALAVLRRMEDDGVPLLYSSHSHVISGLLELRCYAQAVEFVRSYEGRDRGLDTESFGYLGRCFIRRKLYVEAKLVLGEMDKTGSLLENAQTTLFQLAAVKLELGHLGKAIRGAGSFASVLFR